MTDKSLAVDDDGQDCRPPRIVDGADTQYAPLAPAADQTAAGTRRLNRLKSNLLTLNISGVTVDDGVYADAGIVFRDAQGSITRSRVTNVVTSETSYDSRAPASTKVPTTATRSPR